METSNLEDLLDFPCDFPIKAMGAATNEFDALIVAIVRRHAPDLQEGAVSSRESRNGKYLSVTVTIQAHSQAQIEAVYRDLKEHDKVMMVL